MARPLLLSAIVAFVIGGGVDGRARVAAAQEADDTVPRLDEAQFLAAFEAVEPRFERLAAEVGVARAEVEAEGVRPNPSLSLEREQLFPEDGAATTYARVSVPVDISGRRGRRVAAARTIGDAVAAEGEAARVELLVDALRVYYDAAYARLHVETLRTERERLVRVVDVVRKRAGAGASSGYDLLRFELELAAFDDQLASSETRLVEARWQLAALAGDPGRPVDAASSLDLPGTPGSLDEARVLEARADHRAARLRARAAEQRAAAAGRGWIPELGLSVGVMSDEVGGDTALGVTFGLGLTLPVFDRGQGERARARAAARVAVADARVLEARVPAAVRARRETLARRIEQSSRVTTGQLARLDALLRAAETAYREGAGGIVELLDAYQTARDTRLRDLELRRDARLAELDLWLALGRRP